MISRKRTWTVASTLLLAGLIASCLANVSISGNTDAPQVFYQVDLEKMAQHYQVVDAQGNETGINGPKPESVEDMYRVFTVLSPQLTMASDRHLFGEEFTVIPYHNEDNVRSANGKSVARGDAAVAAHFKPGQIGIGLKMHGPETRVLNLGEAAASDDMKEHFKLQDTHIEVVVGVENRDGSPGVVTLNSPQNYEEGRLGSANSSVMDGTHYGMIFLRPRYPDRLSDAQIALYEANIRGMLLGFNAVAEFPGDYNGGDPLAVHTVEKLRQHVVMMVKAVVGDEQARAFFRDPATMLYCAEFAFVSLSAGMVVPLNHDTIEDLRGPQGEQVTSEEWAQFVDYMKKHNAGQPTPFTELNGNVHAAAVRVAEPGELDNLKPAGEALAFKPFTIANILDEFVKLYFPRRDGSAHNLVAAKAQEAVLKGLIPGLLDTMGISADDENTLKEQARAVREMIDNGAHGLEPRLAAIEAGVAKIRAAQQEFGHTMSTAIAIVREQSFPTYEDFRVELEDKVIRRAEKFVRDERDESGKGLFAPPSLFHVLAQGDGNEGILDMKYVGHGIHWSMVNAP